MNRPLVELRGVSRHFDVSPPWLNRLVERQPRQILKAVDELSLTIPRGKTVALVGESGCGKSTLARIAVGLYRPNAGTVLFDGMDIGPRNRHRLRKIRHRLQMIFQDPYASLNPRWRVADIIAEPYRALGGRGKRQSVRARVAELLIQVGLSPEDGHRYPHEFSGGQRQRISIARALSSHPEFLVCDEPTSALDVSVQAQILNLMSDLQQELELTYLFISHDLSVVRHIADQVGVMYLGRLVEFADTETLFQTPQHPYTRLLLDAIPDIEMSGIERSPIGGELPSPIHPPPGCTFHPRCAHASERCLVETPRLRQSVAQPGSRVACHGVEERRLSDHRGLPVAGSPS